jgi:hypothetical protein
VVTDARRFARFGQAQARVADTICNHARPRPPRVIVLQRGRPIAESCEAGDDTPDVPANNGRYAWTIEKHWGPDVVQRILSQRGLLRVHDAPTRAHGMSGSSRPRRRPPANLHKTTRWHLIGTAAVVVLTMIVLLFWQTGGKPYELLTTTRPAPRAVQQELPFDARTSFATTSEPADEKPPPTDH